MRILHGKRVKDYVGKREIVLFIGAFIVTLLVTTVGNRSPVDIMPAMALCPVIGLLFGPFASLGVNLVCLIDNVAKGSEPVICFLDLFTVFIVSYVPYRLWYSTWMNSDARPPVLDSVHNIAKFIMMMLASSLTYAVLYNITYGLVDGNFALGLEDFVRFLNVMSFSFLFGLAAILLLRYLGIRFYTPRYGGTPDDFRRKLDVRLYDLSLLAGIVLPSVVLQFDSEGLIMPAMGILAYVLIVLFLMKPMEPAALDAVDRDPTSAKGIRIHKFNSTLIERIIVLFIIYGIAICLVFGIAAYFGILDDVFGWGFELSMLFYMSVGLMLFFIPALVFLGYIERTVTVPIGALSEAARDFISDQFSSEEFAYTCRGMVDRDTEIGDLARSLIKMTGDMEDYVDDLRTLNSEQEKYRAELNVAQNIQETLVPDNYSILEGKGVDVYGSMEAARYVGGDFYDFYMIDADHLAITVGDVSGKGVPAALFMAVTKYLLEGQSRPGLRPDEIMGKVNLALCRNNDENMFVSSWLGILELGTGRLSFCSAGHNPPVLVRYNKEPELLTTKQCLILGAREGVSYTSEEIVMEYGDRILLYTDGVTEANDHFEGFYGTERLMKVLRACDGMSLEGQINAVLKDISEFTNGAEQFDDMTMLMLRYDGEKKRSAEVLLDGEDVAPAVAPVADAVDAPLDKEDP